MKKILLVLASILFLSTVSNAQNWEATYTLDDFGDKVEVSTVSTEIQGTYYNNVDEIKDMTVSMEFLGKDATMFFYNDSSESVKIDTETDTKLFLKTSTGDKYSIECTGGEKSLIIFDKELEKLKNILKANGDVKCLFRCKLDKTLYNFKINVNNLFDILK